VRRSRDKSKKYKLYNAIRKHGIENFYYEIIEDQVPLSELDDLEIYYIDYYDSFKNGYNSTRGADTSYLNDVEEQEIINRYESGESSIRLADAFNVSWRTILRILDKYKITRNPKTKINNDEDFINDYLNDMPLKEMAEKYNVDIKTIGRKRNKLNLPKRKSG
jgi:hypothetical protein